jgi:hypothetical protein
VGEHCAAEGVAGLGRYQDDRGERGRHEQHEGLACA